MNRSDICVQGEEDFSETYQDSQVCFYLSSDGIIISSDEPIVGEWKWTHVLHSVIDNTLNKRSYPKPGDRLTDYHVNLSNGSYCESPSLWVVWRVEIFNSADENQVVKEVVMAWCTKIELEKELLPVEGQRGN